MEQNSLSQELLTLLARQLQTVERLSHLMQQEQDAIKQSNSESLSKVLQLKNPILQELQELEKQRHDIMTCHSVAPTKKSWETLIQQSSNTSLQELWQNLKDKLGMCKKENEINGRLIHIRKSSNEKILAILLGNRNTPVYGANGNTEQYMQSGLSAVV